MLDQSGRTCGQSPLRMAAVSRPRAFSKRGARGPRMPKQESRGAAMDARTSRYHEVYARSMRDPEGFWGEAAQAIDWIEPPKKIFDPACRRLRPLVRRRRLQHLLQRDRPPCRGAAARDQPAIIYDSPVTQTKRTITYAELLDEVQTLAAVLRGFRRRQGRPRHPLHADGAGSAVRDARLRAHRRRPFGGVRRLRGERARDPHRRRQAEADPLGELRHRARPRRPLQAAARRGDRACRARSRGLPDPAAPAMRSAR